MARCYSEAMRRDQPLPKIWLLSDARNDDGLEAVLANLPEGSGFVFRHYHLNETSRRARYYELAALCRKHRHLVVLAGDADWSADGIYGAPDTLGTRTDRLRLATAHDADEVALSNRAKVDGIFLSPVFETPIVLLGYSG
jgi:thiamine-phosphate pyrophosphorylase